MVFRSLCRRGIGDDGPQPIRHSVRMPTAWPGNGARRPSGAFSPGSYGRTSVEARAGLDPREPVTRVAMSRLLPEQGDHACVMHLHIRCPPNRLPTGSAKLHRSSVVAIHRAGTKKIESLSLSAQSLGGGYRSGIGDG